MKHIGNFAHLIDQRALEFVLSNTGEIRPSEKDKALKRQNNRDTVTRWEHANYDISKLRWESFTGEHFDWKVLLPFEGEVSWWFSKLMPGDIFPWHIDTYATEGRKAKRYFMAYQDYQLGHVFVYEDKLLAPYKAGDVFEFHDDTVAHAAANIGLIPKISLQLIVYQ